VLRVARAGHRRLRRWPVGQSGRPTSGASIWRGVSAASGGV